MSDLQPSNAERFLARTLARLRRETRDQGRGSQAAHRSVVLTDGPVTYYGEDGEPRLAVGPTGEDGIYTVQELNTEAPPVPTDPDVESIPGAIKVIHDGTFVNANAPVDLAYFEIHASQTEDYFATDATQIGTFASVNGGTFVFATDYAAGPWYISIQAVNRSGIESDKSEEVEGRGGAYPAYEPIDEPTTSPTIEVRGNASSLVVLANSIEPGTEIEYYISTQEGFTPGPDNLFVTSMATVVIIDRLPGTGGFLQLGTPYFVRVRAVNSVGPAPVFSAQASDTLHADVLSEAFLARVVAGFIATGRIQIGLAYIDAVEGFVIPHPGGKVTRFPVDGVTPATIAGYLMAEGATFQGDISVMDLMQVFGTIRLASGVPDPSTPPNMTRTWDSISFDPDVSVAAAWVRGLCQCITTPGEWVISVSVPWLGSEVRTVNKGTGAAWPYYDLSTWADGFFCEGGITRIGANYYVLGFDSHRSNKWYIYKLDSAFAKVDEFLFSNTLPGRPAIGTDNTNIAITWSSGGDVLVRYYNTAFGLVANRTVMTGKPLYNMSGVHLGNTELGSSRIYVAVLTGSSVQSFTSGALPAADVPTTFPRAGNAAITGLWWDGTRFYSVDNVGRIWKYGAGHPTTSTVDGAHAWFDGNATGGTHTTKPSPRRSFSWPARSKLVIEAPAPPDDGNTDPTKTDRADRIKFYAVDPAGGTLRMQSSPGTGVYSWTGEVLDTGSEVAKITNEFSSVPGALGVFESTPESWRFYGNGAAKLGPWEIAADGTSAAEFVDVAMSSGYTHWDLTTWRCEVIKDGPWVHVRGLVKPNSGSFTANAAVGVCTLPYPPAKPEVWQGSTNGLADSRNQISAAGVLTVQPTAAATFVSIAYTYYVG